jgi:hypothetical protein
MPVAIKGSGGGSVTLSAGTASADTTLTLPNTTGTIISTAPGTSGNLLVSNGTTWLSTNTFSSGFLFTAYSITTGSFTINPANANYQYVTNNGAYTITAPASDCAVDILITNGASAGATTFSGFTVGASTGSSLTTTNTNKFLLSVRRINGVSTYSIYALQ